MNTEQLSDEEQRTHGFVVTHLQGQTELRVYTGPNYRVFPMTADQVMWLHQQISDVMFNKFRLVPR